MHPIQPQSGMDDTEWIELTLEDGLVSLDGFDDEQADGMKLYLSSQMVYLVGLIPAMETLFLTVEHSYCVKHIYNNFKVNHKRLELKDALWRCATTTIVREFERGMALTDCLVNNLSESFNSMILKSRDKPTLTMLEWIRVRIMTRLYTKRKGIESYVGKLCPNIQDRLEKLKVESKSFSATPADLNGIPCKHEITAIFKNIETPEYYTHPCYLKQTYMEIYKDLLPPMPGQLEWAEIGQLALVARHIYKPTGRSPKQRKRAADEPRNPYRASRLNRPVKCVKCKREGQNARGCKADITGETPWERRQRLQKQKAASGGVPTARTKSGSTSQATSQPPQLASQLLS
ncbi:hypothetical protein SO802_015856 [Lithocarpus litseifolius]|uniref:Uncharacterized protein n=1 Tax=Lithocarpus litseifolius TaxID=425828 RepID=A0AAW2CY58_9ROSI